ncbi:hypothetical protein ACIPVB_02660 [Microbacterium sp. NPDC090007]|uniref:hypothetical protein n=1 Tax=Microbacterium sp. NPDC090007 TaxID=3364204 RepID=UPI0037F68AF4
MTAVPTPGEEGDSLDRIAADLTSLKAADGCSFAQLGRRVGTVRVARGVPAEAASPPRSTVYDLFRPGRTWIDTALLRDIVRALGADESEADRWVERCVRVRRSGERAHPVRTEAEPPAPPVPARAPARPPAAPPTRKKRTTMALLLGGILLNLLGIAVVQALDLPIFLDMVGTAATAIVLGPWHGVVVALAGNLLGFTVGVPAAAPFALVNVAGALVWGFGVHRFGMGDDIRQFFALNLIAAVVCAAIGAPVGLLLFGGFTGHGFDAVTSSIATMGVPVIAAVFSANLLTSLIDKLLTGFIALMIFVWLHGAVRVPATHMPLVERLSAPSPALEGSGRGAAPSTHGFGRLGRRPDRSGRMPPR